MASKGLKILCAIVGLSSMFFFTACEAPEKLDIDASGLEYKFIEKSNSSEKAELYNILVVDLKYYTSTDSLLYSTEEFNSEFKMQMKPPSHQGGSIEDAFGLMEVGDSLIAFVNAGYFYSRTKQMPIPKFIKTDEKLRFEIRLKKVVDIGTHFEKVRGSSVNDEKEEMEQLEIYIKITNTTIEPTSSGLYYVELQKGTGPKPALGDDLSVHYTGTFITGKPFGSSYESGMPFRFTYSTDGLIDGWIEALSMMNEGGKARLIIPSHIAYGKDGKMPTIPPFSTLVFEIELLEVKKH